MADDAPKIEIDNPELAFVYDRLSILRGAFTVLREFGIHPDVGDLLEVSSWLAGDQLPGPYTLTLVRGDDDETPDDERETTGDDSA